MPHELVRNLYAFMLREPMHLHTYVHVSVWVTNYLVRLELICELAHDLVYELVNHEVTLLYMRLIAFYKIN